MSINARVVVRQFGDPVIALKQALQKLRRECQGVRETLKAKEFFVSKSRQRREKERKAAFDRRVGE